MTMNGRIHVVEACSNCTIGTVLTTFKEGSSDFINASVGFYSRISFAHPPKGTVLAFAQDNLKSNFKTYLTIPSLNASDLKVSLPSVSGTIITTGNLDDIVINRLSADFPDDIVANGDVHFGSDARNKIIFAGTVHETETRIIILPWGNDGNIEHVTTMKVESSPSANSILIPASSGVAITTGNLEDITKVGILTNLTVTNQLNIEGRSLLGNDDKDQTTVHGVLSVFTNEVIGSKAPSFTVKNKLLSDSNLIEFTANNITNSSILKILELMGQAVKAHCWKSMGGTW